jgi:hypothetical protein
MVCSVDYGLLASVCEEALGRCAFVPRRILEREYNSRCGAGRIVLSLRGCHLERVLSSGVCGEVVYRGRRRRRLVWGIRRSVPVSSAGVSHGFVGFV